MSRTRKDRKEGATGKPVRTPEYQARLERLVAEGKIPGTRVRRGVEVVIPLEWIAVVTHQQTIRKRKLQKPGKGRKDWNWKEDYGDDAAV